MFLSNKNKMITIISSYVQKHKYQRKNFRISTVETVVNVQLFCGVNRNTTVSNTLYCTRYTERKKTATFS